MLEIKTSQEIAFKVAINSDNPNYRDFANKRWVSVESLLRILEGEVYLISRLEVVNNYLRHKDIVRRLEELIKQLKEGK